MPIAQLVAEHLKFDEEKTKSFVAIDSIERALEEVLGHMVSEEEPVINCLKELSVDEMNAMLPDFFSDEPASHKMDLAVVAKKIAKEHGKKGI